MAPSPSPHPTPLPVVLLGTWSIKPLLQLHFYNKNPSGFTVCIGLKFNEEAQMHVKGSWLSVSPYVCFLLQDVARTPFIQNKFHITTEQTKSKSHWIKRSMGEKEIPGKFYFKCTTHSTAYFHLLHSALNRPQETSSIVFHSMYFKLVCV